MSHITKVKTQLKDGQALRQALKNIHYRICEKDVIWSRHHPGKKSSVEFSARRNNIYIGFSFSNAQAGCYEIFGDWPDMNDQKENIINEITQAYSTEKVIRIANRKGYSVIRNRVKESGQHEIILRKVV